MASFKEVYGQLNPAQKQAVDQIDGPMLVIAGPGTGKTQLLSTRIANILENADVSPSNVLCLTFTDNAARNMRERLETIIGQAAYHVGIYTFHSFGMEVINQYPDFFTDRQLLQPIDELGSYELLRKIFESLPHSNPLGTKVGDDFVMLKDTLTTISWLKQNALTPAELHAIISANEAFIELVNPLITKTFATIPSAKLRQSYVKLFKQIESRKKGVHHFGFPEYAAECASELAIAINETPADTRFAKPITAWRNKWCQKNTAGQHVLKDGGRNMRKMHALANVYQKLIDEMSQRGLYDYDDMIMEVVQVLEKNKELCYNLQERYQYILVDEFQDTNKAQLRILTSLGNNPLFENRPNIMAVGDDDQAIYAFQGAEVSNMASFSKLYDKPILLTLSDSYRSSQPILDASFTVAEQIDDRLETILPGTHKNLKPHTSYKQTGVDHKVFGSELAQYDWISKQIKALVKAGARPEDIAILAPRHKYLERLIPYLGNLHIPVAYERRENILDAPIIKQILVMSKLVVGIAQGKHDEVDALIAEVLAFDFWQLDADELLKISLIAYDKHSHWLPILRKNANPEIKAITGFFLELARQADIEPLEYMIDQFIGVQPDGENNEYDGLGPTKMKRAAFVSPMRAFYFNDKQLEDAPDLYLTLLGQLSTLRHKLRLWKPHEALYIADFVDFGDLHQQAKLKIVDTNPHTQTTNAVQVMTAYKAKGLEFGTVFVINAQDEVWGPTARKKISRITLPNNLPIAPASDGDNDKLRLLFVALTRAKHSLYITSYTHSLENQLSPGLSFIGGNKAGTQLVHKAFAPQLIDTPTIQAAQVILSTDWAYRFRQIIADKPTLFEPILSNYLLSVTHLNNFIDVAGAGPHYFLLHNLLRFPEAPTPAAAYGDAIHKTLQWAHTELRKQAKLPSIKLIQTFFADMLGRKHLKVSDHSRLQKRGFDALTLYFKQRGKFMIASDQVERGFNNDGAIVNKALLSGKLDKIHYQTDKTIEVVDFKTGKPAKSWLGKDEYERIKLHKYRQQLLFYKLLIENSASFRGKAHVARGALEFIEPDDSGKLVENLELAFDEAELERFAKLIGVVWQHIMNLDFPDTSAYSSNLKGIKQFEEDLLSGTI